MNFIEASVFIILFAILSVPVATRFRVPLEVFLVIGSCMVSLIPGLPNVQINPMIIFNLLLPPILFSAAYFTSWRDFKFNLRAITLLAFGLVLFTTIIVSLIAKYMIPGLTWEEGFLLGAIISPTDASSATAIIRKLGAPRKLITILEGESLVNDASALLLFKFALTAIIAGSYSIPHIALQFFIVSIGGATIGLLIGLVAVIVVRSIQNVQAETTFTFIVAFTCYLVAEHVGVSGVISTVVCGLFFGVRLPELVPSHTRINAKASWNTLLFIINGFVFTLIGFELPSILKNLEPYSIGTLSLYGFTISLVIILLRITWVYPVAYLSRVLIPSVARKDPMPSWQTLFVLSWSGMRGIVSLAAALSIPYTLPSGVGFPHRSLLIFISYCVIIVTLILPTITLPLLLRVFHLSDDEDKLKEEALARIKSLEGVLEKITAIAKSENIPCDIVEEYRRAIDRRYKVIQTQIKDQPYSTITNEYLAFKKMAQVVVHSERETLLRLRKQGEIHDDIFRKLSDELDIEELRVHSVRL